MKNELGDKCFADSMTATIEHNHVILQAEVDGVLFESSEYDGDLVKWLQAIVDRVHSCAMGELNFNDPKNNERD
jgi:hypothetical protein